MPRQLKHPSVRQRRNRAAGAAKLTVADPNKIQIPDLPAIYDSKGNEIPIHPGAARWWNSIWSSPMAPEFHKSCDIEGLYRLLMLVDSFWRRPTKDLNSEIRLYEAQFGLNPLARRRLEWQIVDTEKAKDADEVRKANKAKPSAPPAAVPNPYAALQA